MPPNACQPKATPPMSLPQLPNELLLCVSSHLRDGELNALVQASRHFHALLNNDLYRRDPSAVLRWAARRGMLAVAERCLSLGADVNAMGNPPVSEIWSPASLRDRERPLHCAVNGEHEDMLRLLIKHGADANLTDNRNRTPLFTAAIRTSLTMVRLLVDAGSRVDAPHATVRAASDSSHAFAKYIIEKTEGDPRGCNGRSSVSLGVDTETYHPHPELLRTLLRIGSNIESRDCVGRTPLSHAAETGTSDVVNMLIEEGANIETTDDNGRTPMSYARERGGIEGGLIIELLSAHNLGPP